jgi:hypothetical protein
MTRVKTAREWFSRLDEVHELLEEVSGFPKENETAHGRVTVAVLDTGFEPPEPKMDTYRDFNRIRESKSWIAKGEGELCDQESWNKDLDGHGTHVAELLLTVAPVADIHIARVFKTRKDLMDPKNASIVHERIADVWHSP